FGRAPAGGWAVGPQEPDPGVPPPSAKWRLAVRDGPIVAGRPTREVDATDRHSGAVRERVFLDEATTLLLRREQLDTRGRIVRAVGFTSIGEPAVGMFLGTLPGEEPQTPSRSRNRQPRVLEKVTAPFRAPGRASDRFQLVGRYDEDAHTLHLFYSDGLFSVSVFEQKGELDPTGLPRGAESRTIAGREVRQYRTPRAVVQACESGYLLHTPASDAPLDQLAHVVTDFTPHNDSALDRATNFVLGPFSW